MTGRCKYPDCRKPAAATWALVPLCGDHREAIRAEAEAYYRGRLEYAERSDYLAISRMIPWSRINMGEVMPDGTIRRH